VNIRALETLTTDEIRLLARQQAESGEPMEHHFPAGSTQAVAWERAYLERELQLSPQEG
jgi:hypothetical protein